MFRPKIIGTNEGIQHFSIIFGGRGMEPFRITGDRICIGLLAKSDILAVIAFYSQNHERVAKYNPPPPPEYATVEYWGKKIRLANSTLKREKSMDFYLFLPDRSEKIVGHIHLFNIESAPRCSCEIGYTIDALLEGGGYMHEALGLALGFAKNGLGLHKVTALCHPENARSKRLLASLGFREEGVSYGSMRMDDGWQDMYRYSCIL